jgi:ribosomal protein S18 acetylase RimI-like enzyme
VQDDDRHLGLAASYTTRPATWDDVGLVTALFRTCEQDRLGRPVTTTDDIRHRWLSLGGFRDTLLVTGEDGGLAAYEEFHEDRDPWSDELDLFFDGRVHPAATGRGIATWLFTRAEERGRQAMGDAGVARSVLRTIVEDLDAPARGFFTRRGFVAVRFMLQMSLALSTPVPAPRWPEGVAVRHPGPDDDNAVWRTHQAAFADHAEDVPVTREDFMHERLERDPHADRSLWWLAESIDGPVGICLARAGTPEAPGHGHIRDLAVHPDWQRRGIGLALLLTAFDAFTARGLTAADLEVDDVTMGGAVALYEHAGMHVARRTEILEKPLVL